MTNKADNKERMRRWENNTFKSNSRHTEIDRKCMGLSSFQQEIEVESELLRACEVGDIPSVKRILAQHPNLDVNCTDILGRTPLRLAVENEHLDVSACRFLVMVICAMPSSVVLLSASHSPLFSSLQIVVALLDKTDPMAMYDALLLAISLDHDDIALMILQHPTYKTVCGVPGIVN